jgi:type I restriction enzyme M protein
MLVENSLVAVISLPAGVFNPYSGVKTSILILDKSLAKKTDKIAFFKVENDGFGLGAQRREVSGGQLSQVQVELAEYLQVVRNQVSTEDLEFSLGLIVPKEKIAVNGEYSLSGERYRDAISSSSHFSMMELGKICDVRDGTHDSPKYVSDGYPLITSKNLKDGFIDFTDVNLISRDDLDAINKRSQVDAGDILMPMIGTIGNPVIADVSREYAVKNVALIKFPEGCQADNQFVKAVLGSSQMQRKFEQQASGSTQKFISLGFIRNLPIPLPPIAIQKEIVTEIEGYQKVINGARAVIDNYRPHIAINPDWEIVKLSDVTDSISDGDHMPPPKAESGIPFITISNINKNNQIDFSKTFFVPEEYYEALKPHRKPQKDDILYTVTGSYGIPVMIESDIKFCFQRHIGLIRPSAKINTRYLYYLLSSSFILNQADAAATGVAQKTVSLTTLRDFSIPVPPIETQKAIVAEIQAEQALVNGDRELIERFEKKIQTVLNRIWGN